MRFGVLAATLVLTGCSSVQSGISDLSDRMEALVAGPARIYENMHDTDVTLAVQSMQQALETGRKGEAVRWINERTGNAGSVTPQRTFVTDLGIFCRDYAENLAIFGKQANIENTACRTDDGMWAWVG